VTLRFLREGYCGYCSVGAGQLNLCLVSWPDGISALKSWADENFEIPAGQAWRTITPLARDPVPPTAEKLWLVGDAAQVVEPFTGEGIYYAMASGELAARAITEGWAAEAYEKEHSRLYSGRLWVNRISKYAALHPRMASLVLDAMGLYPPSLRFLTSKVVGADLMGSASS
jgi:flavin-dependent dehydrogenase